MPKFAGLFDGYFVLRARDTTGECSLHDMVFEGRDILAVNTAYSCICRIISIASTVSKLQFLPCRAFAEF